jgi:hypothetical protein
MGIGTTEVQDDREQASRQKDDGRLSAENKKIQKDLKNWREAFTVKRAIREQGTKNMEEAFTFAELCSGGCLDTLAAMRVGFVPVWSSEIDECQRRMYEDLTGAKCLGDTFGREVAEASRMHYLKSGQPCPNWSRSGNGLGENGDTGWMFVKQT